jgi:hypothetical protein
MKYLGPPASGSIAAVVFSRNQFGQYQRAHTPPTQPTSPAANSSRAVFRSAVAAWAALPELTKQAWDSQPRTRTNSLGQPETITGREQFIAQFQTISTIGQVPLTMPVTRPPSFQLSELSLQTTGGLTLEVITNGLDATQVVWESTGNVTTAVRRPPGRHPWLRFAYSDYRGAIIPITDTDLTFAYTARFGALPTPGNRTWIRARAIDVGVGRIALPLIAHLDY